MDWADDVTYAVHDVEDFYRAGRIPLDRVRNDPGERGRFLNFAASRYKGGNLDWKAVEGGFNDLVKFIPISEPYSSTRTMRTGLRSLTAALISRYIGAISSYDPLPRAIDALFTLIQSLSGRFGFGNNCHGTT